MAGKGDEAQGMYAVRTCVVHLFFYWITHLFSKYLLSVSYVLDNPLDTRVFAVHKKDKNSYPHANYSAGWMELRGMDKHHPSVNCTHYIQKRDESYGTKSGSEKGGWGCWERGLTF